MEAITGKLNILHDIPNDNIYIYVYEFLMISTPFNIYIFSSFSSRASLVDPHHGRGRGRAARGRHSHRADPGPGRGRSRRDPRGNLWESVKK